MTVKMYGMDMPDGGLEPLTCPSCGDIYTHHGRVCVWNRSEDSSVVEYTEIVAGASTLFEAVHPNFGNPSPRRSGLVIAFECENGCRFELKIMQHKGQTYVWSGNQFVRIGECRMNSGGTYVRFYKCNGKGENGEVLVETNATTADEFFACASSSLLTALSATEADEEYTLSYALPAIVAIVCKLKGYKADEVKERRVLLAGSMWPSDNADVLDEEAAKMRRVMLEDPSDASPGGAVKE